MSLLDEAFEKFTIIDKTTAPDGYGGVVISWKDGAEISAAAVLNSSAGAVVAQAITEKSTYTITTRKNVTLMFHDIIRRESDKKVFRITSDGDDMKTPDSANLNMRNVTAEEWRLVT